MKYEQQADMDAASGADEAAREKRMTANVPVRRYTVEQNFSELIEEGSAWYTAKDYDAVAAERDEALSQLADMTASLNVSIGIGGDALNENARLKAEGEALRAALANSFCDLREEVLLLTVERDALRERILNLEAHIRAIRAAEYEDEDEALPDTPPSLPDTKERG